MEDHGIKAAVPDKGTVGDGFGLRSPEYFLWVHWNDIISPKKRLNPLVAICSRTLRIALLGSVLEMLVVLDTYVQNGMCEEGTHCLDLRCDLNKATWESICWGMGCKRTPKPPKDFRPGAGLNALQYPGMAEYFQKERHGGWVLDR